MKLINIGKNVVIVTLVCLMLSCIFSRSNLKPLKADPSYFTIEATITDDPYWGYYGGYHDIWYAIQTELAKINITLTIEENDMYGWYYKVWDTGWNYTGQKQPPNPEGWDVTMFEWWLQPHAIEPWFMNMILNDFTPAEDGLNIHPWMNSRADTLVLKGMQSFDALTRKNYLWAWQEEWMTDPPIAEIYYPRLYEAQASYVVGYDSSGCWWYDTKHLDINETEFDRTVGPGGTNDNDARYDQGSDTLIYAISEDVWWWSPMFTDTYSEENFGVLCYDTLYTWTLNWTDAQWLQANRVEPNPEDYVIVPELASGYPEPQGGNLSHLRVPLREGVVWSNQDPTHDRAGTPMNATDVKFTYDCTLQANVTCTGYGDFAWLIDSVEVVPLAEGAGGKWCQYTEQWINASAVDFHLKHPLPDFTSVISNNWGGGSIIPWTLEVQTIVEGNNPEHLVNHKTNGPNVLDMHPGTGPYTVTQHKQDQYIVLERNDLHWGFDDTVEGVPSGGYGPYVSKIILKWVPLASSRLTQIKENNVDLGEYPMGTVEEYQTMNQTMDWLHVFVYDYPASNGVWFNFDNQYLSNRYVRQAFAHAIPYDHIYDNILPSWGITFAYPGKTHIQPMHYYEGELLFNDDPYKCPAYKHDIEDAAKYLLMWVYSQPAYAPNGSPGLWGQGPVGDSNFDGVVNFDDFFVWVKNRGPTSALTWLPGCDIDPDFDNDNFVSHPEDYDLWEANWGNEYPFVGAR